MNHPPTALVGFLSPKWPPFVGYVLTIHQLRWWYSKLHRYPSEGMADYRQFLVRVFRVMRVDRVLRSEKKRSTRITRTNTNDSPLGFDSARSKESER
jgi:hypothetical protein